MTTLLARLERSIKKLEEKPSKTPKLGMLESIKEGDLGKTKEKKSSRYRNLNSQNSR